MRTAMCWARFAPGDSGQVGAKFSLMPPDAVQGIVQAILLIRDEDNELGARTAERWRRLVSSLTHDNPHERAEVREEVAWLMRDVVTKALPERLPAIHRALREYGWQESAPPHGRQEEPDSTDPLDIQRVVAPLVSAVNQLSAQQQSIRQQLRGFDRLPIRVQDLLYRGVVIESDISQPAEEPGVSVVDLVIVQEGVADLTARHELLKATQRWSVILMVAKYIVQELAPDRDPEEILGAVERTLRVPKSDNSASL